MVLTTTAFLHLTREVAGALGLPEARIVVVPHPIGGIEEPEALDRARSIVEQVLDLWTGQ